jgi:hypothetical protein
MTGIQNFFELRADGRVITEEMTVEQIGALGEICKVVEVCWTNTSTQQAVSIKSQFGVIADVVSGRKFVAARVFAKKADSELLVFDSNGQIHCTLSKIQVINENQESGQFVWFTSAHQERDGIFGVIFQADNSTVGQYWMDIDAATGNVVECTWTR